MQNYRKYIYPVVTRFRVVLCRQTRTKNVELFQNCFRQINKSVKQNEIENLILSRTFFFSGEKIVPERKYTFKEF